MTFLVKTPTPGCWYFLWYHADSQQADLFPFSRMCLSPAKPFQYIFLLCSQCPIEMYTVPGNTIKPANPRIIGHLLCARHCANFLTFIISFYLSSIPISKVISPIPFYRPGNWGEDILVIHLNSQAEVSIQEGVVFLPIYLFHNVLQIMKFVRISSSYLMDIGALWGDVLSQKLYWMNSF